MASLSRKNNAINPNITFTRDKLYRIVGVLLAMLIAALVGNYVAVLTTRQIADMFIRFVTGIVIGFLVGISVGLVFNKIWNGLKKQYLNKA